MSDRGAQLTHPERAALFDPLSGKPNVIKLRGLYA